MTEDPQVPVDCSPQRPRVLAVGSHPDLRKPGGVITHLRILRELDALSPLDAMDLGSLHGSAALEGRFSVFTVLANIGRLSARLRKTQYEVIMLHQPIMSGALVKLLLVLLAVPRASRSRLLVFFHGGRFERISYLNNPLVHGLFRLGFRRARCFYFLSSPEQRGFERCFPGLPSDRFANFSDSDEPITRTRAPGQSLSLLYVGRIVRVKGVFDIIAAARQLATRDRADFRLTFVGSGPDLAEAKQQCDLLGNRVTFTGFLEGEELVDQYRRADVFLLPTAHPEGFPYVIIEAMRAGLPVISTSEGVLEDLVTDGVNGFRIAFGDFEALADRILRLTDRSLRERMEQANRLVFRNGLSRSKAESFYAHMMESYRFPLGGSP